MKRYSFPIALYIFIVFFCSDSYGARSASPLVEAEKKFLEGRYESVIIETKSIIDSRTPQNERAYYLLAVSQLKTGNFAEARETFGAIISKFPSSKRMIDSEMGIGDSYFFEGNMEKAVSVYNDVAYKRADDKNIALVYYRLGLCHRNMGLEDKANDYFLKLNNAAPLSFEARMVKSGLKIPPPPARPIAPSSPAVSAAVPAQDKKMIIYLDEESYSIQMGLFKSRWNASRFAKGLSSKGYDTYIEEEPKGKTRLYRVKIGKGMARAEAELLSDKLRRKGYKTKICSTDES